MAPCNVFIGVNILAIVENQWLDFTCNCFPSMSLLLGFCGRVGARAPALWAPPTMDALFNQVRFKRSKKRKMHHRVINEVKKETMGFPPGPSLGSLIGNPENPYQISKNIRQHIARLTANDTTHIRRKKDFGRYNFHRFLKAAGMIHEPSKGKDEFVTSLTELQDNAELPISNTDIRFNFPHMLHYKAYWGPPTVETEPNKYDGSMVGVAISFLVKDLDMQPHEKERLIDIVGPSRYDEETGVVTINADIFPERNHNAAFLGDLVQQLMRLSQDDGAISK